MAPQDALQESGEERSGPGAQHIDAGGLEFVSDLEEVRRADQYTNMSFKLILGF